MCATNFYYSFVLFDLNLNLSIHSNQIEQKNNITSCALQKTTRDYHSPPPPIYELVQERQRATSNERLPTPPPHHSRTRPPSPMLLPPHTLLTPPLPPPHTHTTHHILNTHTTINRGGGLKRWFEAVDEFMRMVLRNPLLSNNVLSDLAFLVDHL